MHELSIALSIVDLATDAVRQANADRVEVIELEIGTMAGVEYSALDFAWPVAVRETVLANAERIVNKIEAIGTCGNCGNEFEVLNAYQPCPKCGEVLFNFKQGKELRIKSLIVS